MESRIKMAQHQYNQITKFFLFFFNFFLFFNFFNFFLIFFFFSHKSQPHLSQNKNKSKYSFLSFSLSLFLSLPPFLSLTHTHTHTHFPFPHPPAFYILESLSGVLLFSFWPIALLSGFPCSIFSPNHVCSFILLFHFFFIHSSLSSLSFSVSFSVHFSLSLSFFSFIPQFRFVFWAIFFPFLSYFFL